MAFAVPSGFHERAPSSRRPARGYDRYGFDPVLPVAPAARTTLKVPAAKPSRRKTIKPPGDVPSRRSNSQPRPPPAMTPATNSEDMRNARPIAEGPEVASSERGA